MDRVDARYKIFKEKLKKLGYMKGEAKVIAQVMEKVADFGMMSDAGNKKVARAVSQSKTEAELRTKLEKISTMAKGKYAEASDDDVIQQAIQAMGSTAVGMQLRPDPVPVPRSPTNPVREYVPSARPGAHLPHAWIGHTAEQISTLDLLWPAGFTLLTTGNDAEWTQAAERLDRVPIRIIPIDITGDASASKWAATCELKPGGALLVRPDQHVAWRARACPDNPGAALVAAINQILQRPGNDGGSKH